MSMKQQIVVDVSEPSKKPRSNQLPRRKRTGYVKE
jgi:hypothetical protein